MASYHLPLESSSPKLISQSNNEKNVRQKATKKEKKNVRQIPTKGKPTKYLTSTP